MHYLSDLDDTCVQWGSAKDRRLRSDYPHLTNFLYGDLQTTWDLMHGLDEEHANAMTTLMDSPGFYLDMEPVPGSVEAFHEIVAEGHQLSFVSTPWSTNPTCTYDKYMWLEKHVGEGWGKHLILTHDKTLVKGDILFDDKPKITGVEKPDWTQVVFSQPHNASVVGLQRMDDWSDWRSFKTNAQIKDTTAQRGRNRLPTEWKTLV